MATGGGKVGATAGVGVAVAEGADAAAVAGGTGGGGADGSASCCAGRAEGCSVGPRLGVLDRPRIGPVRDQCLANGVEPLRVRLGGFTARILRGGYLRIRGGLLGCRLRPRFGFVDLFLRRGVARLSFGRRRGSKRWRFFSCQQGLERCGRLRINGGAGVFSKLSTSRRTRMRLVDASTPLSSIAIMPLRRLWHVVSGEKFAR